MEPTTLVVKEDSAKEGNIIVANETILTLYEENINGNKVLVISAQSDFGIKPYAVFIGNLESGVTYEEKYGFVNNKVVCAPALIKLELE